MLRIDPLGFCLSLLVEIGDVIAYFNQ